MGARSEAWRAAFLLAVACTTTHAGEPSWADVLTREAAARPGMDERGAPRATGLPLKYCSHCNAKLVERRCDAAAQTYLLLRYLAALRRFLRLTSSLSVGSSPESSILSRWWRTLLLPCTFSTLA